MSIEKKISDLGIILPPVPKAIASYIPANRSGNFIFTSGQLPMVDGKIVYTGRLKSGSSLDDAKKATQIATLNAIAAIQSQCSSLDNISKVVKLGVYVSSESDFFEQHLVANTASDLLIQIFGDLGRHARFAVGVSALPLNALVELELTVEVQ